MASVAPSPAEIVHGKKQTVFFLLEG